MAIPVIVNAAAGPAGAQDAVERLRPHFEAAGIAARFLPAAGGGELAARAREAMAGRPPLLAAAGGDGTLSALAEVVRGTDTALGILPTGSFNHFARDLGIPLELREAVRVLAEGEPRAVDVGEVNGMCFLNNASLGIYPVIVRSRELQRRLGRRKYPAMVWATLAALRRSSFMHLCLRMDGREEEYRTPFVFVGNNEYRMQGFDIGTRSRIDCGQLSIYTTARRGRWGLVVLALHALLGRLEQRGDFTATAARSLRIESRRRRLRVATDGEVTLMETPLEFRVLPRSLLVMAPREAA